MEAEFFHRCVYLIMLILLRFVLLNLIKKLIKIIHNVYLNNSCDMHYCMARNLEGYNHKEECKSILDRMEVP